MSPVVEPVVIKNQTPIQRQVVIQNQVPVQPATMYQQPMPIQPPIIFAPPPPSTFYSLPQKRVVIKNYGPNQFGMPQPSVEAPS